MDSAGNQNWKIQIEDQLTSNADKLNTLMAQVQSLNKQLSQLHISPPSSGSPPPAPVVTVANEPVIPTPERYAGEPESCRSFLVQCEIQFKLRPSSFPTEESRFRTLATLSGWNETALFHMFYRGLSEKIKDAMAARDLPRTLNELMDLAFRIDRRLRERVRERQLNRPLPTYRPVPSFHSSPRVVPEPPSTIPAARGEQPEPMQIGRTRLSAEEREHRFRNNLCLYCGGAGHRVSSCPVKDSAQQSRGGRC
ncbi:hypothetical protein Q5P01_022924 [Channa striata]|uniref:CCHC-type domain-containing protein n=1 Tax=Channa striata TaxID=64152 RepID=A0AA88LRZ5_CHASR|nr:hypothetical protein Q5P01_022924 [Channa striata]